MRHARFLLATIAIPTFKWCGAALHQLPSDQPVDARVLLGAFAHRLAANTLSARDGIRISRGTVAFGMCKGVKAAQVLARLRVSCRQWSSHPRHPVDPSESCRPVGRCRQ